MFTCLVIFSFSVSFLHCLHSLPFSHPFLVFWIFIITYWRLDLVSSNDFLAATTFLFFFFLFSMLMSSLLLSYRQSHVRLIRLLCISLLEALFFYFSFSSFISLSLRFISLGIPSDE